ncbi:phospholipid scramblase-related protein [Allobranchiibius huperziae]|uniref:Uncharacterized protein YxjI n=1 Tax=Allobranchiibius huperziae TaxID=1874116 RepID=A0A853DFM2_9MICO|nr:phospholipid scramblase-related protein [Allobranchiibius huperziae]NYJ73045.1 uncharacterized protein YxjI [Allobranchiibius huperziae]
MTNATPPGWYPDNLDPTQVRWWDGTSWTHQTQPAQPQQPAPQAMPYPGTSSGHQQGQQSGSHSAPLPGQGAAPRRDTADPYAAQAHGGQGGQQQPHDPYTAQAHGGQGGQQQPHDPYAQQQTHQPAYGQQGNPQQFQQYPQGGAPQQPDSFPGESRVRRWGDSIAQGYGDQSFGGQVSGPVDGRHAEQGRNVFTEPVLVVSQKRKIIEITNEYAVYAQDGSQLGAVVEVGQSGMKKAVRLLSNYDQFLTHRLEVRDNAGQVLLRLTRPAKVFKSTIVVEAPNGSEIGRLVQQNVFGKIRFGLLAGGAEVGSLNAENWRAWNFAMLDASGTEVARVTKTWEGLLTTMFTTADNYVVHLHQDMPDPLRSLCIAAALTIDTALKQDSR